MEKELTIFNRTHFYEFPFEVKHDIDVLETLLLKINSPTILSYCGAETISFSIGEDNFISDDMIGYFFAGDIHQNILDNSTEDVEWTRERNKSFVDIFYRKITLNSEMVARMAEKLVEYKARAEKLLSVWVSEESEIAAARNQRETKWTSVKTFKSVMPRGGEGGYGGYIDASYTDGSDTMELDPVYCDVIVHRWEEFTGQKAVLL